MTRAGVPRKRPGRRPNCQKTPGSGRSKQPIEEQLDLASDALALDVISGKPIQQYGKTGKAFTGPAALGLRQRFAEVWWNRRRPTLTATQVRADVTTETIHKDPPHPRDLARSVLSVLNHAVLAEKEEQAAAEPTPSPPENGQLLLTRDDVIELRAIDGRTGNGMPRPSDGDGDLPGSPAPSVEGSNPSIEDISPIPFNQYTLNARPVDSNPGSASGGGDVAQSPGASPSPRKPRDGDRIDVDENGAHIRFHEATKKWQVLDNLNIPHAWKPTREKALEFARTLPKSSGVPQSDPYGPAEVGLYGDERRDNRATMPGKSKIVRRMPRRSR